MARGTGRGISPKFLRIPVPRPRPVNGELTLLLIYFEFFRQLFNQIIQQIHVKHFLYYKMHIRSIKNIFRFCLTFLPGPC